MYIYIYIMYKLIMSFLYHLRKGWNLQSQPPSPSQNFTVRPIAVAAHEGLVAFFNLDKHAKICQDMPMPVFDWLIFWPKIRSPVLAIFWSIWPSVCHPIRNPFHMYIRLHSYPLVN